MHVLGIRTLLYYHNTIIKLKKFHTDRTILSITEYVLKSLLVSFLALYLFVF